ncbi:MAG: hypothetical protein AAF488_18085 [Planctomycetota bacterium]
MVVAVALRNWLTVALAPCLGLALMATPVSAQDYSLNILNTEVEPGEAFLLPIEGTWSMDVDGFTVALTYPSSSPVEDLNISVDNTLVGELEPDFIIFNNDQELGEAIYAVLFDASPPFDFDTLPPVGFPLLIAELTGTIPEGTADQDIVFDFTDGIGSPPHNNIFVVDFQSVLVTNRSPGQVEVRAPIVPTAPFFIRGDVNMDQLIDLGDVIFHLNYTFVSGPLPACEDAGDANDDGHTDVSDAIYLLDFMFSLGPNPTAPFPAPGPDNTPDPIDCLNPLYMGEI